MTYPEATEFLFGALPVWERAGAGAYKPGLERITAFMAALGNPQKHLRTIHVAGTNGKGSTCHILAAVLQAAGYRTGLFTSPHLVDFRERVRVDGEMIPEAAVVEFTGRWQDEMVRGGLTFFEMATAMALWWFARAGCDVAVVETGLGGRLDSTNIVTPVVSVITNIALEHTQYLGDTITAIAAEKAGIIKPGVPVVIGETDPESAPVFRARAAETGSEIVFADSDGSGSGHCVSLNYAPSRRQCDAIYTAPLGRTLLRFTPSAPRLRRPQQPSPFTDDEFRLDLGGDYQQKNLATVLATVAILRRTLAIPDGALHTGLQNAAALTGLRGRWQVVRREPLVVLDTAHNAHGLAALATQIVREAARSSNRKLFMVMGFAADKDLDAIIPLLPRDAHYILTRADTPRSMPPEELARRFTSKSIAATHIETAPTVAAALDKALSLASPCDMIFVGGSNFVVGEALPPLEIRPLP